MFCGLCRRAREIALHGIQRLLGLSEEHAQAVYGYYDYPPYWGPFVG
jgi:hypothetical protein